MKTIRIKRHCNLKFSRYEVIETGLDNDDLELLISLYLEPEFKVRK